MKRLAFWLSWMVLALGSPSPACACDTVATATPESTCVVLERDGQRGVWFDLVTADDLRRFKLVVPELYLQIDSADAKVDIREEQLAGYKEVLALKDLSIKQASASMVVFARTARVARAGEQNALDKLHAWYRSPTLWAGVGAAVVTAVAVGLKASSR